MPYQLIYTSSETQRMRPQDLADLLETARAKNSSLDVTGLLLYRDGAFIQVLEGDRFTVKDLFDKIKADERHEAVTTIRTEQVEKREFGDWSMGFYDLGDDDLKELQTLDGYSDFLESDTTVRQLQQLAIRPSFAREVLLHFKGT